MPTYANTKPKLRPDEEAEANHRTSVRAKVVHEAIRRDGEEELHRSMAALAWSALAAGLAMGLSLLAEGVLHSHLPETPWRPLVSKIGYSLGFIIVIVGKQQLFTENTLTPIIPVMHNRDASTLWKLAKLWIAVFIANMIGTHLIAWLFSNTPVLSREIQHALLETAQASTAVAPWTAFIRGIPAGWLIALIVWLRAATDSGELAIIVLLTYTIAISGFTHIIAGSVDYLYLVMAGHANWFSFLGDYMLPVLLGNILGGVAIVAALNHAQVVSDEPQA